MSPEKTSSSTRFAIWMALAVLVIIADQATKWAIVQWVDLYQKIPINSFINPESRAARSISAASSLRPRNTLPSS